jgi:hypothetical protein
MPTADHLKNMAAATHVEISQQGNPVPVLWLEVRYGDSHVRTRAIDGRGRYSDSIGANDLTEAVLQVGQVVRFGETMHARKLRKQPTPAAEPARFVRLSDKQIADIKSSLRFGAKHVRDSRYAGEGPAAVAARLRAYEDMASSINAALEGEPRAG